MALAKRMIMMMMIMMKMMIMMMRHANPVDDEDDESFAEDWAKGNGEREWGGARDKENTPNCSACTVRLGLWHLPFPFRFLGCGKYFQKPLPHVLMNDVLM
ncbi:hypothetical protein ACLKA7_003296 [Drosophila subpalustris]